MNRIRQIASTNYGLNIREVERLEGFESENYLLRQGNQKWILKIYPYSNSKQRLLEAENKLLDYLDMQIPDSFPAAVKNELGQGLTISPNHQQIIRVLTYLNGDLWVHSNVNESLCKSLGAFLGSLSTVLVNFRDQDIESREAHWNLNHAIENYDDLSYILDPVQRKLVHYFLLQYKEHVLPVKHHLRQAVIHNDANDWNLLVRDNQVIGLLDFGDVAYSSQIAELAVACTYAAMNQSDPLKICLSVLSAYHEKFPLASNELEVLYYFIGARLCKSLCASWHKKSQGEDTPYAVVSEKGASDLLEKWVAINPLHAIQVFKSVTGNKKGQRSTLYDANAKRDKFIGKSLSLTYKHPIHMDGAAFQYMFDVHGNSFLDAYNNIMLVGHCHPAVVEAGQRMMARLNTNTRYHYDVLYEYSESLLSHFPSYLNRIFFVNSGSAASDLAIRMARVHTGAKKVAVLKHGYHGNTALGIDISHYKYNHKGGQGKPDFVIELELPDIFRGIFQDPEHGGDNYAKAAIQTIRNDSENLAAFIAEPIVGCGGQVPLAPGYLRTLYPAIKEQGGLCISDEVQVGFNRLGTHFWGFEYHGVEPDIVVLGKPMGNGHPIGAVVTTAEIAESFDNGMEFFSSFGGNPVSCAVGQAVLNVLKDEELGKNALQTGEYLMDQARQLSVDHEAIGDVRGSGLFIGIDMVKVRSSRDPNTKLAHYLKNQLREKHILTGTDGPADNVLKIKPPLCFNKKNVDTLIDKMDQLLKS